LTGKRIVCESDGPVNYEILGMKKGAKTIHVTSPYGATSTIRGSALEVAKAADAGWITVHERQYPQDEPPLVAMIPDTWLIELVLNDAS
jgi:hypothetical protein